MLGHWRLKVANSISCRPLSSKPQFKSFLLHTMVASVDTLKAQRNSRSRPSCSTNCESRILIPPHSKNHKQAIGRNQEGARLAQTRREGREEKGALVAQNSQGTPVIHSYVSPLLLKSTNHWRAPRARVIMAPERCFVATTSSVL